MIVVAEDGLWAVMGSQEKVDRFCSLTAQVEALAKETHGCITVRQFYNDMLGIKLGTPEEFTSHCDYEPECFVDPDEYGWDDKGYRQLYRTKIVKERL